MKTSYQVRWLRTFFIFLSFGLITLGLWILDQEFPLNLSKNSILRYIGQISALNAVIFLSFNYILAARYKMLEKIFLPLDKLYRLHMFIGIFSYILVLIHPLALAARFLGSQNNEFYNYFIYTAQNSDVKNLGIVAFWLLTLLIFGAGLRSLPYHIWKLIHLFMGLPLMLGAVHGLMASGTMSSNLIMSIWIMTWVILGLWSYIYKLFLYEYIGPVFKYKIHKIQKTDELFNLELKPLGKRIKFIPGQFAFIKFFNKDVFPEPHPYSMASTPDDEIIEFSIKKLGDWSSSLDKLNEGEIVKVMGPYGHFHADHFRKCAKQVWIGGGIGITPFLGKVKEETKNPSCDEIHLIYSDNNKEQAVFTKEIKSLAEKSKHLNVICHLSDNEGYLSANQIEEWIGDFEDTIFLMCGPSPMTSSVSEQLIAKGVDKDDIVYEFFNFK